MSIFQTGMTYGVALAHIAVDRLHFATRPGWGRYGVASDEQCIRMLTTRKGNRCVFFMRPGRKQNWDAQPEDENTADWQLGTLGGPRKL